jgi:hypothetical protein
MTLWGTAGSVKGAHQSCYNIIGRDNIIVYEALYYNNYIIIIVYEGQFAKDGFIVLLFITSYINLPGLRLTGLASARSRKVSDACMRCLGLQPL